MLIGSRSELQVPPVAGPSPFDRSGPDLNPTPSGGVQMRRIGAGIAPRWRSAQAERSIGGAVPRLPNPALIWGWGRRPAGSMGHRGAVEMAPSGVRHGRRASLSPGPSAAPDGHGRGALAPGRTAHHAAAPRGSASTPPRIGRSAPDSPPPQRLAGRLRAARLVSVPTLVGTGVYLRRAALRPEDAGSRAHHPVSNSDRRSRGDARNSGERLAAT